MLLILSVIKFQNVYIELSTNTVYSIIVANVFSYFVRKAGLVYKILIAFVYFCSYLGK